MLKYFSKRLLQLIPVILGVTLLVFMIMQLASGDPARLILGELATQEQVDELREEMGLNDPVLIQYGRYIFNCLKGDFGTSYIKSRSVTAEVLSQFPNTMKLAVVSLILTVILSVPLGIWASIKQNSPLDSGIMVFSLIGISMPVFWLGLLLMIIFLFSSIFYRHLMTEPLQVIFCRLSVSFSPICLLSHELLVRLCWKRSAKIMFVQHAPRVARRKQRFISMRSAML